MILEGKINLLSPMLVFRVQRNAVYWRDQSKNSVSTDVFPFKVNAMSTGNMRFTRTYAG